MTLRRHLLVTNDFPPKVGGIQAYLWELWRRLDPETFVVLTASSDPNARAFDRSAGAQGIRIERVPGRVLYFPTPGIRARIRSLASEVGATLVLLDPVLPLGLLGPRLGIPYGVVLHGAEVAVPARLPATRRLAAQVLAGSSIVVSAGRYPAAEAARVLGARGEADGPRVVCVPPGVDCTRFRPLDDAERAAARRRLGLPPDSPVVASVSRLVPRKGMDVLIEAVCRLRVSYPDLVLAIAGTGREEARLVARARRSGAPVRFLGRVSEQDKGALLASADVFSMACRNRWRGLEQEGFGIVFLEAAASGTPQVAGDSGGAAEAVDDGVTGVVVRRPQDPGDVATALRRVLADADLRRRMGDAARDRACRAFGYAALARRLAAALAEVQG
ncbi:MAG TPA: glycosyltransferase family 4 protein [Acidimicrobiales bacterium]|nr:glycosyltransferase family 4 protein [Acidimicrobiales bacterium]